jgi:hypothetical protein
VPAVLAARALFGLSSHVLCTLHARRAALALCALPIDGDIYRIDHAPPVFVYAQVAVNQMALLSAPDATC